MCSVPVHEIYEHLRIFLVLLHLHCVRQDHVQIKNKVLDLEKRTECDLNGLQTQHFILKKLRK